MTPVLEARGVSKTFAGRGGGAAVAAVSDVSFALQAGGALAVVGGSGSGKTTLARVVIGMLRPTGGVVVVDGRPRPPRQTRRSRRATARQLQMVFQDPRTSLDPRQTISAGLSELVRLHGEADARARDERVGELLSLVGLSARNGACRPSQLSGGQCQRAAIARALAADPEVLILDEAVAALDVSIQAQILSLLADIRSERQIAYLFISHDLAVVRQTCEDVVVMHRGHMVEAGTVDDVLTRPQHAYTRELVDSVPRPGWRPRVRAARLPGDGEDPSSNAHDRWEQMMLEARSDQEDTR